MEIKMEQVREAAEKFAGWQGTARIYCDFNTLDVWCNIYTDSNSWTRYRNKAIVEIYSKDDLYGRNDKVGAKRIVRLIKRGIEVDIKNVEPWRRVWELAEAMM